MSSAYSLSRKQGWRRFVDTKPRTRPDALTAEALARLGEDALLDYNDARCDWHANFGTIATPQLTAVRDELELIVASNRQDPDRVRGAAVLDGYPGLGKTTIVNLFGRDFHRSAIHRVGDLTGEGHEHIPVFRVGLTSNTTLRTLNKMICQFYGHPAADRGSAAQLATYALDCVLSCETRVGIIDDIHFIRHDSRDGLAVSNHLKWLANELPVTFIYAGVGLGERRFFEEGLTGRHAAFAQSGRRWTRLSVELFDRDEHWRALVKAVDRQVVLARSRPGQLSRQADYLFSRTGGHIGSLMTLINRGCFKAIRTGTEALSRDLLDSVRIDETAEKSSRRTISASVKAVTR
ncbi:MULTISPECIES: TniB family NTP-binding protein [Nocardia]|uniref:TniB family NTP-binding protein n=1 Tax=Nocardia TaxID=1817 RepID=UPI001CBAFCBF|nr:MULTISPECIES: TniB family NTP-binding protein [Nocardia]UAK31925.1 TniB family NTP-binding protein [Nocardia asteroides]UAK33279.1 TniB family NTP-binding protein [Nocardia asteroides]